MEKGISITKLQKQTELLESTLVTSKQIKWIVFSYQPKPRNGAFFRPFVNDNDNDSMS